MHVLSLKIYINIFLQSLNLHPINYYVFYCWLTAVMPVLMAIYIKDILHSKELTFLYGKSFFIEIFDSQFTWVTKSFCSNYNNKQAITIYVYSITELVELNFNSSTQIHRHTNINLTHRESIIDFHDFYFCEKNSIEYAYVCGEKFIFICKVSY